MKHVLYGLMLAVMLAGCKGLGEKIDPAPIAVISGGNFESEGYVILSASGSKNATTYFWDFGDGNTSESMAPNHTYARNGQYTILLKATGASGKTHETTKTLTVRTIKGRYSFWIDWSSTWSIDITVDGRDIGALTQYFPTTTPTCGQTGMVTVTLPEGVYAFTAKQRVLIAPKSWSGTVQLVGGDCRMTKLSK